MKTKIKRMSKRTLAVFLGVMMLVTSIGIGSIITADAYSISDNYCRIYFDNTVTGWSNVCFCAHWSDNNWLEFYSMNHIEGTNLWVWNSNKNNSSVDWFAFAENNWGNQSSSYDNLKGWNKTSAKITESFDGGYAYMYSATSQASYNSGTGTAASLGSRLSAHWDAWADSYKDDTFKTTHHLKVKTKANGASSYSDNNSGNVATMKFKDGYYLYSNYNSADHGDGTGSTTDATFGTVKSGYFKLNYSSLSSDYKFDGWGNSSGIVSGYGSSATSNQFTNVNSAQTYYGYFSEKTHSVAVKQKLGSGSETSVSTKTIGNLTGVNVSANASVSSGGRTYSFDHWLVTGAAVSISTTSSGTYTSHAVNSTNSNRSIYVKTSNDDAVLTAVYTLDPEALTAPAITYNSSSNATQAMNASKGNKARIAWSAVSNAGSYEVYKGSSKVATVTTTYYDIERGNSYGGAYTVKAVPSDSTAYSTSAASNSITFTFNKVAQPAPTVTGGNKTIDSGTVAYTLSGGTGTLGTDYKYQHTAANGSSYSDVTNSSWTTGSMTTAGSYVYKFKTVALATDYYTDSSATSDTITVRTAYKLYYVDSASQSNGVFTNGSSKNMTYDSTANAYYANFTVTNTSNFYYRMATTNLSTNKEYATAWNGGYPGVYDVVLGGSKVTATTEVQTWSNKSSLHYSGSSPKIIVWYDGEKTWITDNAVKHNVTITQPSATGSSIKVEGATTSPQQFYEDDTVNYTVTAGSGNVITSVTVGGTTTNVDRKTSYEGSFTLSADTAISATVVPQYSITANSATGGTYTVKRGGSTVTKFIAGDSLTLTPSASTHYDFTNFTISGGKTATLTANPSTLDTTGATGNITITPTWTPKSYTVSTAAKYSTTGASNSYTNNLSATITTTGITNGTATNASGFTVSAPATVTVSGVKYSFYQWAATNGDFTLAVSNNSNTFKPTANGAVATAQYKKVYTITSSVDNTGTGAGTVSTNKTEVEAGGGYTITSTVSSDYHAIESVKVNGTSQGTSATTNVNNVTSDQTVLVKFKSRVQIKGTSPINSTAWAGEDMTSIADGTSFSITKTLEAGTTYQFRLYAKDDWVANSVTTWDLNDVATHGTSGDNLTITPSVKVNVTFVSDGTKFTSITAVPYDSTTYNVTLKKVAGSTITCTYMGTNYSTASADAVVPVYSGTSLNFTATAAEGKYLSGLNTTAGTLNPQFAAGDSYTGTLQNVTSARTVTPTVANKLAIQTIVNKSSLGSITIDPTSAIPGERVEVTVSEKSGTYVENSLTVTDSNGATVTLESNRSGTTKYFDMPATAVTVSANFTAYQAESSYYYNGYQNANDGKDGYFGQQMTEAMINGKKFSYYHVTGRGSENYEQYFTVSNGRVSSGTRYVYFTQLKAGGWDYSHAPYAYFIGGNVAWPGTQMDYYTDNDMSQPVYRTTIPAGATGVVFNDGNTHKSTDINNLTAGGYYVDEYSVYTDGKSVHTGHTYNCTYPNAGAAGTGTEYLWSSGSYVDNFYSGGFYDQGSRVAKPKDNNGNNFSNCKNDYYIVVLYPGETYTIEYNGHTTTNTVDNDKPWVIWMSELPTAEEEVSEVEVYAKDGATPINWNNKTECGATDTSGSSYNFAAIADTMIYASDATTAKGTSYDTNGSGYETAKFNAGDTFYIKTTIASAYKSKYYVRGFCVNGTTYYGGSAAQTENSSTVNTTTDSTNGVYSMYFTIPADAEYDKLEITPIYYLSDNSDTITFYLEGYNDIKDKWGNTPYVYPFYGDLGGVDNSFGSYPGQPMVYVEGKYSMEIPIRDIPIVKATPSTPTKVKGITISNGYADHVHRNKIYKWTDHDNDADHKQTYDYDDFYKIYEECLKNGDHPNSIIFRVMDEEKTYNRYTYGGSKGGARVVLNKSSLNSTDLSNINSNNGWELLTNRYNEPIDLFGNVVSTPATAATEVDNNALRVVSTGYNANIAGDYGTAWRVYYKNSSSAQFDLIKDTSNDRYAAPPSIFLLRGTASGYDSAVDSIGYPSASHNVAGVNNYTDDIDSYEGIYKSAKAYVNKPVYITYEKDAQDTRDKATGTGAYRLDGRWYYTHAGDEVQSTIGIEYWDNSDNRYKPDTVNAATGEGSTTGCTAKFNSDSYKSASEQTTSSKVTINSNTTWNFAATAGTGYKFDGWYYKYSDTSYDRVEGAKASASIKATASYELIARFVPIVTGYLSIDHTLASTSTGAGTTDMQVKVYTDDTKTTEVGGSGNSTFNSYHVYLDDTYISNTNPDYYIEVQLRTTPDYDGTVTAFGYDSFNTAKGITPTTSSLPGSEGALTTSTFGFTVGDLYSGNNLETKALVYTSTIAETLHYYIFTYNFTDRYGSSKTYTSKGKISLKEYKNDVTGNHVLDPSYIAAKAPFESNFMKTNTLDKGNISYNSSTHTFTATSTFNQSDATPTHHVTIKLPYKYHETSGSEYKKYNASDSFYDDSQATFDLVAKYNTFVTINATSTVPDTAQAHVEKVTDKTDVTHTGNDFLTAPDQLDDNGTPMYFSHWLVKKKNADGDTVTKIFFPDFNYRIYSDYYVEAVYSENAADSYIMKLYNDGEQACSIMYLGDSRNQWNQSSGDTSSSANAADKIYSDFMFKYSDNGQELHGSSNKIGMILERVTYDDNGTTKYAKGDSKTSDMSVYKSNYGATESARKTAIYNALNASVTSPTLPKGVVKVDWNTNELNNKNFMQQSYAVFSRYGQTDADNEINYATDNTIDDYVYRAYAYMKCSDGTLVLSDPTYFCMKSTSSKNYSE